ncbi:hypothetical protein JFT44_12345 [Pseudomonas sp. MF5691]|uniref:hypothetical protein n=1 Tax=Pseudomonas sp. MF5691 TaxID=2797526 RepID=UPI0018E71F44|nr:hypothetical protein [Pseudomonas sp. MF5691]MBJ2290725.1 hypothetical protein [Pseudomonas sp. MF5691]
MSRQHQIAVDLIDRWFTSMSVEGSTPVLHGETTMIVETAYALSAITDDEHQHYKARLHRLFERQHRETMQALEYRQ